jgi:hypothetical protein
MLALTPITLAYAKFLHLMELSLHYKKVVVKVSVRCERTCVEWTLRWARCIRALFVGRLNQAPQLEQCCWTDEVFLLTQGHALLALMERGRVCGGAELVPRACTSALRASHTGTRFTSSQGADVVEAAAFGCCG